MFKRHCFHAALAPNRISMLSATRMSLGRRAFSSSARSNVHVAVLGAAGELHSPLAHADTEGRS